MPPTFEQLQAENTLLRAQLAAAATRATGYAEALTDAACLCRSRADSLSTTRQYLQANEAQKCAGAIEAVGGGLSDG